MFREAINKVNIEGILNEVDLKYITFKRDGEEADAISGTIKVLVEQNINGEPVTCEIPVYLFSSKYTRAGVLNKSYESIERVMNEYVSVAACGSVAQADRVRITNGRVRMNDFYSTSGNLINQVRVETGFVGKAIGDFRPKATFELEFVVSSIDRVTDSDGVEIEPTKLKVQAIVPRYTAPNASVMNVDVVPLYVTAPAAVNAIENNWEAGNAYHVTGRLNFSSRTEEYLQEFDFGEPQSTVRTINVSELIITAGSDSPLDEEYSWKVEDIKEGIAARKQRIEDARSGKTLSAKQAPSRNARKGKLDLGF